MTMDVNVVKMTEEAALVEGVARVGDTCLLYTSQPYAWFRNLVRCFGDALEIRTGYMGGTPVGSILTLRFRDTVYYKYGSSDEKFDSLGAMPFLLGNAIRAAKSSGAKMCIRDSSFSSNRGRSRQCPQCQCHSKRRQGRAENQRRWSYNENPRCHRKLGHKERPLSCAAHPRI